MNQINSLLSAWKKTFNQQGQVGKILLPVLLLFLLCCLCSIPVSLFRSRGPSNETPSPNAFPSPATDATPTPLFDFDFPTFTPIPTSTFFAPSALPTLTPPPTETQTPITPSTPTTAAPTASQTETPVPTDTATQVPPSATATLVRSVAIVAVHKAAENVDIQNISSAAVDLGGWRLVSETGDQSCALSGTLAPNQVLRIWARRGPGFDCRFGDDIWLDNQTDPAVLYNANGEEVSRYP